VSATQTLRSIFSAALVTLGVFAAAWIGSCALLYVALRSGGVTAGDGLLLVVVPPVMGLFAARLTAGALARRAARKTAPLVLNRVLRLPYVRQQYQKLLDGGIRLCFACGHFGFGDAESHCPSCGHAYTLPQVGAEEESTDAAVEAPQTCGAQST
jgi:hypothetical protein